MPAHKKTVEEKQATRLKNIFYNAMDDMDITQSELAKRLQIDQSALSRLIRNPLHTKFETILKVANALNVDLVSQKFIEI